MMRIVLLKLIESFFQRFWLLLLPVLAMLSAGGGWIAISPSEYTSSGTLYVEKDSLLADLTSTSIDGSWWVTSAQMTINEINELMSTRSFVRSAIQRTNLEAYMSGSPAEIDTTIQAFRDMLWMRTMGDKVVSINATSEDPQLAQQVVNATLESYIQWKLNTDYQESVVAQSFFVNLIKPYEEDLERARNELMLFVEYYPEPVRGERPWEELMELQRLQANLERAEERVNETLRSEESARLALIQSEAVTRQAYTVIDTPDLPLEPNASLTDMAKNLLVFVAIGVVMSLGILVLNTLLDSSFRFAIDVRHSLSLPVLAVVPVAASSAQASGKRWRKQAAQPPADPSAVAELQPQISVMPNSERSVK
jgi:capsular polysaccharide biosynthesis protein